MSSVGIADIPIYSEKFTFATNQWTSKDRAELTLGSWPDSSSSALLMIERDTALSPPLKLQPSTRYILRLNTWSEERGRFYIEVNEYDSFGKQISIPGMYRIIEQLAEAYRPERNRDLLIEIPFDTAANSGSVVISIHKWGNKRCWFDNVTVSKMPIYDLVPQEQVAKQIDDSVHSVMLEGPDGIMYPNWSRAGVLKKTYSAKTFLLNAFGGKPDDGMDDSAAFCDAISAAAENGGGVIELEAGTYNLTRKLYIEHDQIVLRGKGSADTKIVFAVPESGVFISSVSVGPELSRRIPAHVYFFGDGAVRVELTSDGKRIAFVDKVAKFQSVPGQSHHKKVVFSGSDIVSALGVGERQITAKVAYKDGTIQQTTQPFRISESNIYNNTRSSVVTFAMDEAPFRTNTVLLTKGVRRGDNTVEVTDASIFSVGDYIVLAAPSTPEWNRQSLNECKWGNFRYFVERISDVNTNTLVLNAPSRMDLPLTDKPYVHLNPMIKHCGVEGLTIQQKGVLQKDLRMGAVLFCNAVNCWADDITVVDTGHRPVYGSRVKNCTFSDCVFKGAWNHGGSTAYAGFDYAWDCLIERVQSFDMRHGPILNWACSGNVIRDSVFKGSDAQWHSGWCQDNLFEQCSIDAEQTNGGYGYAFYASPYNDSGHGPQGPRNVIYNCTAISAKSAVFLGGGGTYDWLIMYNTLIAKSGPGIIERLGCRSSMVVGNVFVLHDQFAPMVYYEFLDSLGDQVINNTVYGGCGLLSRGASKPELSNGNTFRPIDETPITPKPPVPSLYLWQKNQEKRK